MTTTMATSQQDALITEIEIGVPRERVFQALIDPQQVMRWWTSEQCQIRSFTMDPRLGGRWTYSTKHSDLSVNGVNQFSCDGEVLEYDPRGCLATPGLPTGMSVPSNAPWCDGNWSPSKMVRG